MARGIHAQRSDFKPTIDETIRYADDELIHDWTSVTPLRSWYEAEADRRYAEFVEKRDAPVELKFDDGTSVTLTPGTWCEPLVGANATYRRSRPITWRNARYMGRVEGSLYFMRYGAKIDPWTQGKVDTTGLPTSESQYGDKVLGCALIEPDPKLVELLRLREQKAAESRAFTEQLAAQVDA